FEKSQASEFLLSKRHAIMPKLQQLMAAALAELEGLLAKALSGPFMDPTQDQRSTEHQLVSLERQFQNTVSDLSELHHAYAIFTGTEDPRTLHYHSVIDPSTERMRLLCPCQSVGHVLLCSSSAYGTCTESSPKTSASGSAWLLPSSAQLWPRRRQRAG
ncbi:DNHD1 isoform 15, partial [Pan troglodytes]